MIDDGEPVAVPDVGDRVPVPDLDAGRPADRQPERVRASWDQRAVPAAIPQLIGRALVAAVVAAFGWQLAVRALGLDADWAPAAMLQRAGDACRPVAYAVAHWVASWTDLLKLLRRVIEHILQPVAEEAYRLLAAMADFVGSLMGESARGFVAALVVDLDRGGGVLGRAVPGALHAILASTTTLAILGTLTISLEACGIVRGVPVLRPSFWIVSCGNAIFETSRAWTSFFCVQVRLVFEFRDTILAVLRRIPYFDEIWKMWDRAARFVGSALRDVLRAIPQGYHAAVRFFFGPPAAPADAGADAPAAAAAARRPDWYADAPVLVAMFMITVSVAAATFACYYSPQCVQFIFTASSS